MPILSGYCFVETFGEVIAMGVLLGNATPVLGGPMIFHRKWTAPGAGHRAAPAHGPLRTRPAAR